MTMSVFLVLVAVVGCLGQEFDSLQEMLDHNVEKYRMIGVDVGGFSSDGTWIKRGQSGERVYGEGTPISDKDMFIMGSAGKSMTSTMAARVVAQGYLNWTTTTKEMFHDTGLFNVHESFWPSTLEQFLSHGSGAPGLDVVVSEYHDMVDYIFNKTSWDPEHDNRPERQFLAKTLLENEVTVPQGKFLYSIGAFTIAGAMLELATGKTYEQLMIDELFTPLSMDGCGFGPTTLDSSLPPVQPWGHLCDQWAIHNAPVTPGPYANVASSMIPDGGLHCNLDSWNNYLSMHLREDEDFLPKDQWQHIHTPITQGYYGFGWFFDNQPIIGPIWQHGGTDGHNFAQAFMLPQWGIGVIIGVNNAGTMQQGSLQGTGFGKVLEWVFGNLLAKEMGTELAKEMGTKIRKSTEKMRFDDSLHN